MEIIKEIKNRVAKEKRGENVKYSKQKQCVHLILFAKKIDVFLLFSFFAVIISQNNKSERTDQEEL